MNDLMYEPPLEPNEEMPLTDGVCSNCSYYDGFENDMNRGWCKYHEQIVGWDRDKCKSFDHYSMWGYES